MFTVFAFEFDVALLFNSADSSSAAFYHHVSELFVIVCHVVYRLRGKKKANTVYSKQFLRGMT